MTSLYMLDTNVYFMLFQMPKIQSFTNLESKIKDANGLSFYISEITSLEIHSVLGKYSRSIAPQKNLCERDVIDGSGMVRCLKQWVTPGRKKMNPKVFKGIRKMISDIEGGIGDIRADVLKVDSDVVQEARNLLYKYADVYNFGSHDAMIAGAIVVARKKIGLDLTLVTSDKGLKAALKDGGIPYYDPREANI